MRKCLILTIILCLTGTPFGQSVSAENIKWKNMVSINQQTTIAQGDQIEVNPGTQITLSTPKSKINILGKLAVKGSEKEPVIIVIPNFMNNAHSTAISSQTIIKTNSDLKELEIHPYSVETEEIVEELEAFRKQYAFVWVVLMGIQIYLVLNRSTYW